MNVIHDGRAIAADEVTEALHGLATTMTVRAQYPAGHPALARADAAAALGFEHLFVRFVEVVLAVIDGEIVINERPFPELRRRLSTFVDAMIRHHVECFVFQRGITAAECGLIGSALASPGGGDANARRVELQAGLTHVLLRFAALVAHDPTLRDRNRNEYLIPLVQEVLDGVVRAVAAGRLCELEIVRKVAARIVGACQSRTFVLEQRAYAEGLIDDAAHAANVATITAAIMLEAGRAEAECIEGAAAALLHDLGVALLPAHIRGLPTPLLSERDAAIHRQHPVVGASALLCSGCPPLWVAAALDHHRGVDGRGYPIHEGAELPDETVRLISLASYFDRKRTIARGASDEPEQALRSALALEGRYFGRGTVASFMSAVGVYPPGTVVELSNGATAIVLYANATEPLRPRVQVMFGEHTGKHYELKDLNGAEDRYAASIVRAISPPLSTVASVLELEEIVDEREENEDLYTPEPWPELEPPPLAARSRSMPIPREDPSSPALIAHATAPSIASLPSMPPRSMLPPPVESRGDAPSDEEAVGRLGSLQRVPRLAVQGASIVSLGLDPRAGFVLSFVDGSLSLEDILDASGLPRWEVARILNDLLALNVLAFDQ